MVERKREGYRELVVKKNNAFTAIELLAVIAIILTIIGIGLPAYNSFRNRGKIAKAKAVIAKLEMALEMYKTDFGEYPGALDALINVSNPSFGPYIDSKDFSGGRFIDPWGTAYEYNKTTETVSILSYGPDKGKGTNDDISNITPW